MFSLSLPLALAVVLGGYLLGSIPFGVIVTRLAGAGDVRKIGSGNIGATNVLRTGRKDLALATLIGDGAKGAIALLIARWTVGEDAAIWAGAAAFLGHLYPVWLRFKGGKGVATFLGLMIAAWWPVGLAACATWLLVFYLMRFSSLAALAAAALSPLYAFLLHAGRGIIALALFGAVLIFIRHHENIARLLKGEEPKVARKAKAAEPAS